MRGPDDERAPGATLFVVAVASALVGIAAVIALTDTATTSIVRHAYVVPVVAAGVRFGFTAGVVTAVVAVLLHAPFVLPGIEQSGVTVAVLEAMSSFAIALLLGGLSGALTTWAQRERGRYRAVLAVQRALADDADLETALGRVGDALRSPLRATAVAVVIADNDRTVAGGATWLAREPAVLDALSSGRSVFVPDLGTDARPHRLLVVPVIVGGAAIGALAVTRLGEFPGVERRAVDTLGAYVGLALENARLASRQRRFADELAAKVAAATERLAEADRAKSMFVATASHELRTPLTALLGFSELLARRTYPGDQVKRFATLMTRETERLVRIVEDLLDLSRLERGLAPTLHRTDMDVAPLVEAAIEPIRATRATHEIVVDCAPDLPRLHADPDALDRVLKNLATNAVKYSPPGIVRVTVHREQAAVVFSVVDRGPGIPRDVLPRLFEPFYRAPDAAVAARGTGIGLAIVKALVEAHGGAIAVASEPSVGTRVTFTIPVVP